MAAYTKSHPDMDQKSLQIIQRVLPFLESQCECEKLVADLFSTKIFSADDMEQIRHEKTVIAQNKLFLIKLMRRGPQAYPAFVEALKKHNQGHVAERLRKEEELLEEELRNESLKQKSTPSVGRRVDQLEDDFNQLEGRVDRLEDKAELEELREKLNQAKRRESHLNRRLQEIEQKSQEEVSKLKENLKDAHEEIRKLQKQIKAKEQAITSLQSKMAKQNAKLEEFETKFKDQEKTNKETIDAVAKLQKDMDEMRNPRQSRGNTGPMSYRTSTIRNAVPSLAPMKPPVNANNKSGHNTEERNALKAFTQQKMKNEKKKSENKK